MNNTNDNYPHTSIHPLHHEPNYNYPYTELEKFEKFDQNIDKEKIKERWNNVKKILQ